MAARRSLWPREHGAYAQLLAPLATALALRTPALPAWLLAIAACFAFLANEPLLVVLGHRGPRLREARGRDAARWLALAIAGAAVAGGAGLLLASPDARALAAVAAVPAVVLVALAWVKSEHSQLGELVAAVALPAAALPVAAAAGVAPRAALEIWIAWAVGYACTVVAVHRVIARHRAAATWVDPVLAIACAAVAGAGAWLGVLEAVPLALAASALVIWPPSARRLRAVGVALVIASVAAGAIAVATSTSA